MDRRKPASPRATSTRSRWARCTTAGGFRTASRRKAWGADDLNQIQAALDFDARPRRVELVDARLIRDSGRRRATLGGDMAVVWEAV